MSCLRRIVMANSCQCTRGFVCAGKGNSYRLLMYDSSQRHICIAALLPDVR